MLEFDNLPDEYIPPQTPEEREREEFIDALQEALDESYVLRDLLEEIVPSDVGSHEAIGSIIHSLQKTLTEEGISVEDDLYL